MCIYKQTLWSVRVIVPFKVHTSLFGLNFPWHNDCSPLSYLSNYIEIILFGVVFMGENAKRLKKVTYEKHSSPHISTMGALYNIIQTYSGSYSARLRLLFLAIFSNWSCDHHPNMLLNDPWQAESSLSCFLGFLVIQDHISFWGVYVEDPDMDPEGSASLCTLSFSEPSTILLLEILKFPFLDIYLEPDNSNLEVSKDHINSTQQ